MADEVGNTCTGRLAAAKGTMLGEKGDRRRLRSNNPAGSRKSMPEQNRILECNFGVPALEENFNLDSFGFSSKGWKLTALMMG